MLTNRDMRLSLASACVGIVLNIVLSYLVPNLPHDSSDNSYYVEVIEMFKHHNRKMLTSSLIVAVAVAASVALGTIVLRKM
jgi:hypothetical protein